VPHRIVPRGHIARGPRGHIAWAPWPWLAAGAPHILAKMVVRVADPTRDAGPCARIYAPYVRRTAISFEEEPPSTGQLAERIERSQATHQWLVAEDAGEVVGYAYGCPHRERSAYRWASDVSVYVDPQSQRRGFGRALYGELIRLLRNQGLYAACAGITLPNDASVGLHESLGFRPVGVYRKIGFKLGCWWDVGWWQLALREPDRDPAAPRPASPRLSCR
jgi:L-amino acid N-acyltransferase YncA